LAINVLKTNQGPITFNLAKTLAKVKEENTAPDHLQEYGNGQQPTSNTSRRPSPK